MSPSLGDEDGNYDSFGATGYNVLHTGAYSAGPFRKNISVRRNAFVIDLNIPQLKKNYSPFTFTSTKARVLALPSQLCLSASISQKPEDHNNVVTKFLKHAARDRVSVLL